MKGIPKHLNTKQDFLNIKEMFPDESKSRFQELLDTKDTWMNMGKLEGAGIEDKTHKILGVEMGNETLYQMEYKEDPNARIFRLGFTVEELEGFLA